MSVKSGLTRSGLSGGRTNSGQLLRASAQQNIMTKYGGTGTGFNGTVQDKKNTAIITYDELQRIRQQCSSGNEYEIEQRNRERLELQDKSKARVSQWPNTIEAMRQKKDEERIRRLEEEEIERRKIDAMEYELQVQARIQAIERANKTMHDAQDQVKAFHSKMLMCDVTQEREMQTNLKKRKLEFEKQIYNQWEDLEQQKMQEYDEKMRSKLMEEYEKKMQNQKIIGDQLQDFKMTCVKRIQDEMLEGELLKRQVQEELERERQKEMEKKRKLLDQQDSFKRANIDLQLAIQEEKKKALEEEKRIEEWAKKRDALEKLRKDKEEQKFQEKQETRQRLIEKQSEILRNMKNKEDEILSKQVFEAEEKANKLFEEQERRKYQMKDAIERSRQQQIDRKNLEKNYENQEQKEFSEFWKIRNEELAIAEQQEKEEERLRNEELKSFLKRQMDNKQKKVEDQFKQELQSATQTQALLDHQEKNFYSYAEQCVKEWQDNGKNVKPLVLQLKGYKKQIV